ncbi:Tad domain-containing protein [Roseibium salinum]|uniref:Tad domain-containing protein n=1 Tax=Roseibium salinum TaxID=1604349 RepID=A0ABT3R6T3_9HYPH|nr:Tad domain-containing protein [Roseibium sp. DSM 29163]MCX2724846.1 Tad domain-containing protein [Roseibium sp. DSM 29163]
MNKSQFNRLRSLFRDLVQDKSASILPLFGLTVVLLVVMGGLAVDISRAVSAREKLSYALDAAALSLAAELSSSLMTDKEIKEALSDSMKANLGNAEFLDEALKNLTHTVDPENGQVSVSSSASLENYFLDIGGFGKEAMGPEAFTFGTSAQATFSRYDVELAMVLDVTGSMASHVESLKKAAWSALNILIPKDTSEAESKVRISMIPYSEGVNLGEFANKVAQGAQGTQNCVTERLGAAQFTDDPYDYDSENENSYFGGGSKGCAPSPQLEPLTAKRNKIDAAIGKLTTSGGTAGQTGIAWGWYTLSPKWADLWPKASVPASYDDEKILKFAIIMTDGDFNRYYYKESLTKKQCQDRWYITETCKNGTNEYWRPDSSWGYWGESSQRAMELCSGMKAEGIKVYSIFFGPYKYNPVKVMENCASENGYYYANSEEELIQAFGNIAKKIQAIHLSK